MKSGNISRDDRKGYNVDMKISGSVRMLNLVSLL